MKPVNFDELLGLGEYEALRDRLKARVIGEKKRRRVRLGDRASCLFENHDTVLWQIQEMLRTERITKKSAVMHEIETYNELIGGPHELSATLMIEIEDKDVREEFLARARGLEAHVHLDVDGERVPAVWDKAREHPQHLSAVMYLKFPLGEARAAKLAQTKVVLAVDHPAYTARAELPQAVLESLAEDCRNSRGRSSVHPERCRTATICARSRSGGTRSKRSSRACGTSSTCATSPSSRRRASRARATCLGSR
jgi:hypothetical protein